MALSMPGAASNAMMDRVGLSDKNVYRWCGDRVTEKECVQTRKLRYISKCNSVGEFADSTALSLLSVDSFRGPLDDLRNCSGLRDVNCVTALDFGDS